jgi:hypothetical protein
MLGAIIILIQQVCCDILKKGFGMLIKRTGALLEEEERFFLIQVALKDSKEECYANFK